MRRLLYELTESLRIAFAQIAANRMRSALTALGVIIGIIAVTLMGTAIGGIDRGFDKSMSLLGDDVLYLSRTPWGPEEEFWQYRNRPEIRAEYAEKLNRIFAATPNSRLEIAVPSMNNFQTVASGNLQLKNVFTMGTTHEFPRTSNADLSAGRFLTEMESRGAANVCILGKDVAEALFPNRDPLDQVIRLGGKQNFRVIGVFAKQGSFLGLFSWDNQIVVPLSAFLRYFKQKADADIRVKVRDKLDLPQARQELTGAMRRVRGVMPDQPENFAINEQQGFRDTIGPVKTGIAVAGLFITGLALFVGAIGIMNITFVSVKERTREIGTRMALGARRRTILLQFLIEAVSICLVGGLAGLAISFAVFLLIARALPDLPVQFSGSLLIVALAASVLVGVASGFAPAWSASRLNPVEALRYE